ncbi:hypothetical protein ACCO45_002638 [Purpureocillium lilacinum]|uniref:Uncharacterized protein n=1 Tax=Purpureocillium lilacinum TaxID=33203 RepID=A0ACC4EBK6_PURLI
MARAGSAPRVGQHPPPTPSRIASHEVAIVCRVEYGFGGRNRRMFHDLHLVTAWFMGLVYFDIKALRDGQTNGGDATPPRGHSPAGAGHLYFRTEEP